MGRGDTQWRTRDETPKNEARNCDIERLSLGRYPDTLEIADLAES
jgi:hypothetical protein